MDYAAPEQLAGLAVDGRADQYALGCTAFELLCGQPPFRRDQGLAAVYAHLSEPPPLLSAKRSGLPAEADDVFTRVLEKDPANRYASCQEFAEALRLALRLRPQVDETGAAALIAAADVAQPAGPADVADVVAGGGAPAGPDQQATGAERPTRRRRRQRPVLAASEAGVPAAAQALEVLEPPSVAGRLATEPVAPASHPDRPETEPAGPSDDLSTEPAPPAEVPARADVGTTAS